MLSLISNITLFLSSIIYFLFKNLQKKLNIFLRGFKKFEVNLIDVSKKKNPKKQVNVLIMDTVHHRLNIYTDCILIEYLQNIFNCKITGLMEKNDNQSKSFFNFIKSKNIIEINDSKIFKKLKFFFQAFKIIKNFKSYNINKFIELKIDEINLGRSVYDHIIRLTRIGKHNRYNSKFVNYLADALYYKEKFSNIFKYNHFEYLILSELQFLPSNILIQVALKHNVKVVSRILGPKKIGVRIYKKFEERFQSNNKILNEMFKKIPQKNLEKYSKIGYKKIKGIYKKKTNNPDFFSKSALIRQNKFENKKDLLMHFGWKDEKKICTIFSPNMIDGNFYHEMKLFPDIQTWLEQTLNIIKKSEQNINLLVRPHPSESYFPKLITKTENIFKERCYKTDTSSN